MHIPYVIDNREHRLSDVLNELLGRFESRSMDIASAYFSISGFKLLQHGLRDIGSLRLLLGAKVGSGEEVGLRPKEYALPALIGDQLESEPFDESTLHLVEDLIAFLRQDNVQVRAYNKGFLHAKCYIMYGDKPEQSFLWDRFQPLVGVVGSSNFTGPGLTSNQEMNLTHRVLLEEAEGMDPDAGDMVSFLAEDKSSPRITEKNRQLLKSEVGARAILDLVKWFEGQWGDSVDFKEQLIDILNASKFGEKEYSPYQVYIKALYEYLGEDVSEQQETEKGSAVDLTVFQEDAVRKARKIMRKYSGVMIADSVGLGKTWIGKKLLEDYAYHLRNKALVVSPASLRSMWQRELSEATIPFEIESQEMLGQVDFDAGRYGDVDVILVEESHNFRNRHSQRYQNLERIINQNGGRGRSGERKKVILLSATPINNDLMDLYSQLSLITQGDEAYFASAGIADLKRYFLRARRNSREGSSGVALFNLLDEVVIRRTRSFIRDAYPEATIGGEIITFPERRLSTIKYDLETTYKGIYDTIVSGIESLNLSPYNLESYKRNAADQDDLELGREKALVGIFKSRYLKRFESSVEAFRISVKRSLEFFKTFNEYLADRKLLNSADFRMALRYIIAEDEEDDAVPTSRAEEMDDTGRLQDFLSELPEIDLDLYDLRKLQRHLQKDIDTMTEIWHLVRPIIPEKDAKLQELKHRLANELKGKKVLVFSYFKDTARYVERQLVQDTEWWKRAGRPTLHRLDSGTKTGNRDSVIRRFAPKANQPSDIAGTDEEIDILISTDVLSEGQNLQDCGCVLNYDLHWNPTRMVQRAGRCDRIGSQHDTLFIHNMFPEEGLERLLGIIKSLTHKVSAIDGEGFLDEPVLAGQVVHPRTFNTMRRIQEEDDSVIVEEEDTSELPSNESLQRILRNFMDDQGRDVVEELPDGIHSGLHRPGKKGMFFYFKAIREGEENQHFWRYYDLKTGEIIDNRWLIANMIQCEPDTPRIIDDFAAFDIQEKLIEHIVESQQAQLALEKAPAKTHPLQITVSTILRDQINNPEIPRGDILAAVQILSDPMSGVQIRELREAYNEYGKSDNGGELLKSVLEFRDRYGKNAKETPSPQSRKTPIERADLRLVCFDYICS